MGRVLQGGPVHAWPKQIHQVQSDRHQSVLECTFKLSTLLRASMATAKDRLDSLESQLQSNRQQMTKQAKKAAKLEKKLKILTGGYLSRNGTLVKQMGDLHEQTEQANVELETFRRLQELEEQAIPKRTEVRTYIHVCVVHI